MQEMKPIKEGKVREIYDNGDSLNYLIYNDPLGYADLILNGNPKEYLRNVAGSHGLEN